MLVNLYGARRIFRDNLHDMGSRFPEAYVEMDPQGKARCEQEWLAHAAEADLIFGFRKPQDLTLEDRFLAAIVNNNPDPAIREYARAELPGE